MTNKPHYHILARPGGKWACKEAGKTRAVFVCKTRDECIAQAFLAPTSSYGVEIIIHEQDGSVRSWWTTKFAGTNLNPPETSNE